MTPESARVRRDENGRWCCRPYLGTDRVTGRPVRPSRYWPATMSRDEAQAACDAWLSKIAPEETGIVSCRLGTMLADYIDDPTRPFSPSTRETYRSVLRCCIEPTIGSIPYNELRAHEVRRAYISLMRGEHGRAPVEGATLKKVHTLLKGAYAAWGRARLTGNPMLEVDAPRQRQLEPHALDTDDRDRLARALAVSMAKRGNDPETVSERTTAFAAYLALNTGLRCGEVCGLRLGDWRREHHDLHVAGTVIEHPHLMRQDWPKGGKAGNVSLAPATERRLAEHADWQRGWLNAGGLSSRPLVTYSSTGAWIRPSLLSLRFTRLVRGLGLPEGTTFHTLRHTHATWLLMHGYDARTVQERLRHSDVATTLRVYGSVMPGRDADAAAAFTGSIDDSIDLEGEEDADS